MSSNLYRPFASPTEIRLLQLSSTLHGNLLHANLLHTDLSSNTLPYEALSYTWGSSTDHKETILLNQNAIEIRQNLFRALKQLQVQADHTLILYVDALCINQTDLGEKANQVFMIGRIFGQAQRVLAWLGEHDANSEMLFSGWPADHDKATMLESAATIEERNLVNRDGLTRQIETLRRDIWSAFFQRSFWSRMWIVQELVQAQSIIVCCGASRAEWMDLLLSKHSYFKTPVRSFFSRAAHDLMKYCGRSSSADELFDQVRIELFEGEAGDGLCRLEQIFETRRMYQLSRSGFYPRGGPGNSMSLFNLVYEFKDRKCSVQLDRVYALMTLEAIPDRKRRVVERIYPDYSLQIVDLFLQVCKFRLKSIQNTSRKPFLVADMFEGLNLASTDAETVIDHLLDEYSISDEFKSYDEYVFTLIARAFGELGLLNPEAVSVKRSYSEIREFLVHRRIQSTTNPSLAPQTIPSVVMRTGDDRVSRRSLRGYLIDLYHTALQDSRSHIELKQNLQEIRITLKSMFGCTDQFLRLPESN